MPKIMQAGEFFVVGGPVQSDRPCYVERSADGELHAGIADQRFCYVLSARATGKSSLMARTIRRLRREGQLAAVVDLTQIGARGESADAGRWYYSIAYRIVRDLRLKIDLQYWWQEKSALLGDQRLVEFFWEIVLTNTTAPVTIFIDEAERALELSFSSELFSAIRSCYLQRVTEPDYARLNFVVLGVAAPERLCPNASVSPFADGQAIELPDFKLTECYQLGAGLSADTTVARALIERIYAWTGGHPYLTQKVARGVARKGGRLGDVERVIQEQFLAPRALEEEPLLSHIRALLTERTPAARQALVRLGKLVRGAEVGDEPASAGRELLELAGVVTEDAAGKLGFRNQIFARVFDERWARSETPANWRMRAGVAAAVLAAAWLPYWYAEILPRPYVNTLSVVTQDYAVAESAYARLKRLPFHAARADRLLADVMVRRSERATTITEVLAADSGLREALSMPELADEMLAKYWLRQSVAGMRRGDRDVALLYAMEARRDAPEVAAARAAELIDSDYARLQRTFRLTQTPLGWDVDWETGELVVVDQAHRIERVALELAAAEAGGVGGTTRVPGRLTAIQHVPVARELNIDDEGTAGAFNLLLTVQHSRASDLVLTLTAPSGATATLAVPQPRADQHELIFNARGDSALAMLADEPIFGRWRLTLVDRRAGDAGSLSSWGLQFTGGREPWLDAPEQGVQVPDPFRSEQVEVVLGPAGRLAVAQPARSGAGGTLGVWDLRRNELRADLEAPVPPEHIVVSPRADRVLAVGSGQATLWDIERGTVVARFEADSAFPLAPAQSSDERFVALAAPNEDSRPTFTVIDVASGERVARFPGIASARGWVLGAEARFLAVLDGTRRALLFDPRAGTVRAEIRHHDNLVRLLPTAVDGIVVTVDARGAVHGWSIDLSAAAADAAAVGASWLIGTTADPSSVSVAADAVAFALGDGLVVVQDVRGARQPQYFRPSNAATAITRIAPGADRLVTASGGLFRSWDVVADPPLASIDRELSAVALDEGGEIAAFGFRGGHVRVSRVDDLGGSPVRHDVVDYIGHRGEVTSLAVNAARNLIASGGSDGVVRIWNMTTVAPSAQFLRHLVGPIGTLRASPDGTIVVSGAEYSARVWHTGSGELLGEIPVDGAVLSVAISARTDLMAVGDTAGNIFFGPPRGTQPLLWARARAGVQALAISPDSTRLVSGDRDGNLEFWDVALAEASRATCVFPDAVSWVGFTADGEGMLARSGPWLHELRVLPDGLTVVGTRLLPIALGPEPVPALGADGTLRWLAGPAVGASLHVDLGSGLAAGPAPPADAALLARDWPARLGLELDRATGTVRSAR